VDVDVEVVVVVVVLQMAEMERFDFQNVESISRFDVPTVLLPVD
jgi:hypothetical protein